MRRYVLGLFLVLTTILLSGCSGFSKTSKTTELPTRPVVYTSASKLPDSGYFVLHSDENGTTYSQLYWNDRSFKQPTGTGASVNPSKVLWFHDDWSAIPTLYAGDYLVMRNAQAIPEKFTMERYRYDGYTIGICNIERNKSGNYVFDTKSGMNVSKYSDAARLNNMNNKEVILYSIGGVTDLGRGNFSDGGTLVGLEKDALYKCVFYRGTRQYELSLRADSVALNSMEVLTTVQGSFLEGNIVAIQIPAGCNSGYYNVDNAGIFRYVNGTSYDENTDFNVPNDVKRQEGFEEGAGNTGYKETLSGDTQSFILDVNENKQTEITVTFDGVADASQAMPVVKVIGSDSARTLSPVEGEERYHAILNLPIGRYTIEVSNTGGRKAHVVVK